MKRIAFFALPGKKPEAVPGEATSSHPVALYVVLPIGKFYTQLFMASSTYT